MLQSSEKSHTLCPDLTRSSFLFFAVLGLEGHGLISVFCLLSAMGEGRAHVGVDELIPLPTRLTGRQFERDGSPFYSHPTKRLFSHLAELLFP